jgi:hypothetical protein
MMAAKNGGDALEKKDIVGWLDFEEVKPWG